MSNLSGANVPCGLNNLPDLTSVDRFDEESIEEYRNVIPNLQYDFDQQRRDLESMEKHAALFTTPFTIDVKLFS